ncbi:hypothetical protein GCM10009579_74310 [Streptomyces javensis]|uniref:Uncharacterized protein n=1 Tax=Streptomyces javensis TaxID=114698 RepID=A0ABN1XAM1_9ACTN
MLVRKTSAWGADGLTPREAALVRALSWSVAVALRRACANTPPPAARGVPGPGVLVLDQVGRTVVANEMARYWLHEPGTLPLHVVAAARAGRGGGAYLRVRARTGRWLSAMKACDLAHAGEGEALVGVPSPVGGVSAGAGPPGRW